MERFKKLPLLRLSSLTAFAALSLLLSCQEDTRTDPIASPTHASARIAATIGLENAFPNLTFNQPVEFTHAGDGSNRVFVVEKGGRIKVFTNDPSATAAADYLTITDRVFPLGEGGLLGLAFHPRFAQNGYLFVHYTKSNPAEPAHPIISVISRFKATRYGANTIDPATETVVLTAKQPPYENHKGGKIAFGPDGYLYIALGDGGGGGDPLNNGQNRATLLGKLLRIDIDQTTLGHYGIPADNPYVGNSQGFKPEIWAYGLRNPWKFSFDIKTRQLWLADVGQARFEEIDLITRGGNYGWRLKEASACYDPATNCHQSGLIDPIFQYGRTEGQSITGGFVYRGRRLAALQGKYVYGDFVSGKVWALTYSAGQPTNELLAERAGLIAAFGEDANRELYVVTFNGIIKRFVSQ